ncbi:putative gustatory receptor 59b [Drosophila erecta]|uniref:Gustatory receptor n=1 Tax=Drosophila erecta TaxID=7220 RepID=B3NP83_DROER|nr:putative gustatory receptor 59b [Drosophila erecta]EDV56746.2 Gr59b [Drosophila erecta]
MVSWIVELYFRYSLAIGITSQQFSSRKFYTTLFSRTYALIANIITLTMLPIVMWQVRSVFLAKRHYPQLILITNDVRYTVSFLIILYTLLSRGFRDTALKEMQPLLLTLFREEKRCGYKGIDGVRRSLRILLFVKFFTLSWLCITDIIFLFYSSDAVIWVNIARFLFLSNTNNILEMVPMGYFLALWHIARGFDCVNRRLDQIVKSKSTRDQKELQHLWFLHTCLTKTALNINKIYAPQMLATRFDHFVIGVIQAYWGAVFTFDLSTSFLWVVYGSVQYHVRSLDYYLIDYMCDVAVEYHDSARHSWSEIRWTKEISSYVVYANSSKLQLWTCGLFQANRSMWFGMISSVFYYILVLLQFHLVMGK